MSFSKCYVLFFGNCCNNRPRIFFLMQTLFQAIRDISDRTYRRSSSFFDEPIYYYLSCTNSLLAKYQYIISFQTKKIKAKQRLPIKKNLMVVPRPFKCVCITQIAVSFLKSMFSMKCRQHQQFLTFCVCYYYLKFL